MKEINFRYLETPEIRKSDDASARKMTFVASDGTRDSYHTVLDSGKWDLKRFNKNGIIAYQHKAYGSYEATDNPDNIIGRGKAYIEKGADGEKRLLVDVEFEPEGMNALADKVWAKLCFGTLKAVSVGFRPTGKGHFGTGEEAVGGERETYYYGGQELLEVSVVNIPANPNALKRGMDEGMEDELKALREEAAAEDKATEGKQPEGPSEDEKKKAEEEEAESLELQRELSIKMAEAALL